MKNILISTLLVFILSGCTLFRVLNIVNNEAILEQDYYYVIPFESKDDMILVKVRIGGEFYDFIFDTGAFTVLSDQITERFHLIRHQGPRILDSQGNRQSIDFAIPDTLSLENLHFIKPGCGIYDFKANPELSCFSFQGILGVNVMRNAVCQVNFNNHTLVITNDLKKLHLSDQKIKVSFVKHITGQPIVSMRIDGIKIRNVILDYGSGAGFNIASKRLINHIEKKQYPFVEYTGYNAIGLFGKKNDQSIYYRSGNVSLSSMKIDTTLLVLTDNGISTVGVEFLRNYIVTLDFRNSYAYFEPSPLEKGEGLFTFGLTPLLIDGKLIVSGIFNPSPAREAGIQEGDQILSVDGRDFTAVDQDQYCDILRNGIFAEDKDTTVLQIKTADFIKTITLVKKELLK